MVTGKPIGELVKALRWMAAPVLVVPTGYGGYSTMVNFWQAMGLQHSLWLYLLAGTAGLLSGLMAVAKLWR
jgi:hypothetical protein